MGPVLTMLALLACRASCTPPDLASQDMGHVNHACPPNLPFTFAREPLMGDVFHDDLATLVLHTLVEILLVARVSSYINHQIQRPIAKVRLHFREDKWPGDTSL